MLVNIPAPAIGHDISISNYRWYMVYGLMLQKLSPGVPWSSYSTWDECGMFIWNS